MDVSSSFYRLYWIKAIQWWVVYNNSTAVFLSLA